jgi:hypothetical protein
MTARADPPAGAISYERWLLNRIAHPGVICGPDVIDNRPWWQYLPGLNPHADLERQARQAERTWAAVSRAEAEAG